MLLIVDPGGMLQAMILVLTQQKVVRPLSKPVPYHPPVECAMFASWVCVVNGGGMSESPCVAKIIRNTNF